MTDRAAGAVGKPLPLDNVKAVLQQKAFCTSHHSMIRKDADGRRGVSVGAAKIKKNVNEGIFLAIRTYARPELLERCTAIRLREYDVKFVTFITAEDPRLPEDLESYCKSPQRFVFGPKGGDKIVEFMRRCALKAKVKGFITLDDNITKFSLLSGDTNYVDVPKGLFKDIISKGASLLNRHPFCSIAAYYNPMFHCKQPQLVMSNYSKDKEIFLSYECDDNDPHLLYTAFLGVRTASPGGLAATQGGGQDDLERTTRAILSHGSCPVFTQLAVCKGHMAAGGLTASLGGKENRLRAHEKQNMSTLRLAWGRCAGNQLCEKWRRVRRLWIKSKFARNYFKAFLKRVRQADKNACSRGKRKHSCKWSLLHVMD